MSASLSTVLRVTRPNAAKVGVRESAGIRASARRKMSAGSRKAVCATDGVFNFAPLRPVFMGCACTTDALDLKAPRMYTICTTS